MPHFLVLLYDGTDAGAPARRQAARDAHLGQLKEKVGWCSADASSTMRSSRSAPS
jgi:hypothetical protein